MKKVAVITRHAIPNYGSLFQAIATQRTINELGYDCKIIDYIREDEYKNKILLTSAKTNNHVKKFPFLIVAYYLARLPEYKRANEKFSSMREKWLDMTTLTHDFSAVPDADIYATGSDQVWGPVKNAKYDMNYFLDFAPEDKRKVALSASFGKMDISDDDKNVIFPRLKRYDAITVRERQAVEFLASNKIEAQQVLDPTLLIDGNAWRSMFNVKKDTSRGKYILIYQIHRNEKLVNYAKKLAEKQGLPLIRVAAMHHQKSWGGKLVETPDLKEFLEYLDNAECLVTDSFHGTAFALNLNTRFVTLMPETGTSSRNLSLLELVGMKDKVAKNENDLDVISTEYNFDKVNDILAQERKKTIDIYRETLDQK